MKNKVYYEKQYYMPKLPNADKYGYVHGCDKIAWEHVLNMFINFIGVFV